MKPLDLSDKYEPLSYTDEYADPDSEPTVKIHMSAVHPQVILTDDDEPTLPSMRNPLFPEEKRYPGVGLIIVLLSGAFFWGAVLWYFFG